MSRLELAYAYPTSTHAETLGRRESGAHYIARVDRSRQGFELPPKIQSGPYDSREQAEEALPDIERAMTSKARAGK